LLVNCLGMETNKKLAKKCENIIFKIFICLIQRQHLQNTTRSSKPLKELEEKTKKRKYVFVYLFSMSGNMFI